MQRQNGEPELVMTLEDQDDLVTSADALLLEERGTGITLLLHIKEAEGMLLTILMAPEHCSSLRLTCSDTIDNIIGEIELIRYPEAIALDFSLTVIILYQIFFVQIKHLLILLIIMRDLPDNSI